MGVGTGLVLKRGFSQGSSDTVAKILHKKIFNFMGLSRVFIRNRHNNIVNFKFCFWKNSSFICYYYVNGIYFNCPTILWNFISLGIIISIWRSSIWPVLLKAIRLLGDETEQGRLFGFLEAGRGVVDTI